MIVASAHRGETTLDAIVHLLYTFSSLGLLMQLKTDNGPAYTSKYFKEFWNLWNINNVTRIPYNPQGQGVVEQHHQYLNGKF